MSQNLSFDIKIPEGHVVQFEQESTFENFIGQFQIFCPKLLCVIDGSCLRYYDKPGTLPSNIRFDYKQRRGKLTEYYFRDIGNDSLYCVFGREAAKIFYPRIDEVDPIDLRTQVNDTIVPSSKQSFTTFKGTTGHNYELNSKPHLNDPRSTIISPSSCNDPKLNIDVNMTHNYEMVGSPKPLGSIISRSGPILPNNHTMERSRNPAVSQSSSIGHNNSRVAKHPIIQPIVRKDVRPNEGSISDHDIRRGNLPKLYTSSRKYPPDHVVIIDKGVKLIFPNSNYPIEIHTHHPNG